MVKRTKIMSMDNTIENKTDAEIVSLLEEGIKFYLICNDGTKVLVSMDVAKKWNVKNVEV